MKRFSLIGLSVGALGALMVDDLRLASIVSLWGDIGPLVIVGALAGALLWKGRLGYPIGFAVGALALLWTVVAFSALAAWLADGLPRRDPPAPADAVFVASSSIQRDGDLTSSSMGRLVHGLELLAEGQAPVLVLADVRPPKPSYAGAARSLLDHLGIQGELVTVGPVANTRDEALAVAELCGRRGWRRLIVVTSPYHSRRACSALEHQGLEVTCSPSVETAFDAENLVRSDERRRAFAAALHERIGLWVYGRRGWLDGTAPSSR